MRANVIFPHKNSVLTSPCAIASSAINSTNNFASSNQTNKYLPIVISYLFVYIVTLSSNRFGQFGVVDKCSVFEKIKQFKNYGLMKSQWSVRNRESNISRNDRFS